MTLVGYHGTKRKNWQRIKNNGFKILKTSGIPNDLGMGIYAYCPDESNLWDPKENVKEFVESYRGGSSACVIISLTISKGSTVLNLDSEENKKILSNLFLKLRIRANKIWKAQKNCGMKRRHNIDGIVLELAFKKKVISEPDVLLKETYTAFVKDTISNFPNGREMAIRNIKSIQNITKQIK